MAPFTAADLRGARKTSPAAPNAFLVRFFEWFGDLGFFGFQLVRAVLLPPYEVREFAHQLDELGSKSLPLVALAGAAMGVVLSLETHDSLVSFGAKSLLPALLVVSIIKESGPIITGLIVSGRVAAGIGAELGAMKVSEQIDAMEASAVDPPQVPGSDTDPSLRANAAAAHTRRGFPTRARSGLRMRSTDARERARSAWLISGILPRWQ
jgi:hypothetical protein